MATIQTDSTNKIEAFQDDTVCPAPKLDQKSSNGTTVEATESPSTDIIWNEKDKADILGAYFIGYSISQVPMSWAGRRFGRIRVITVGMVLASLIMIITPLLMNSISTSESAKAVMFTSRLLIGLLQGGCYPLLVGLWGKWAPKSELSRLISVQFAGSGFGTFIILPIVGYMTEHISWESSFYFIGFVGCLCGGALIYFGYDSPEEHPSISEEELNLLRENVIQDEKESLKNIHEDLLDTDPLSESLPSLKEKSSDGKSVPWLKMATSVPLWAVITAHFASNFGSYILQTYFPSYLNEQLHYNITKAGLISSIPNILKVAFTLSVGFVADFLTNKMNLPNPTVRKAMTTIGLAIPAFSMLIAGFLGCQPVLIISLLFIAFSFDAFTTSGFKSNHNELSPEFSGILFGITNTIGNFPGFIGPMIAGSILDSNSGITGWKMVFSLGSIVYLVGNVAFLMFSQFTVQEWN